MHRFVLAFVCLTIAAGCAGTSNRLLNSQLKASQEYFAAVPFTAVVDFHVHGNHFVDSNGKPMAGDQSKRLGSKGLFTKDYAVARGEKGHIFYIGLENDHVLKVCVSKGTGLLSAAWNPSNIEIHYSRPITERDLTPQSVARALSSLMVIENLEPGSEINDILDELDTTVPR